METVLPHNSMNAFCAGPGSYQNIMAAIWTELFLMGHAFKIQEQERRRFKAVRLPGPPHRQIRANTSKGLDTRYDTQEQCGGEAVLTRRHTSCPVGGECTRSASCTKYLHPSLLTDWLEHQWVVDECTPSRVSCTQGM